MRRLLLLALLCAACSNSDRAAPDSTNFQAAETHGPDPLLLRVPRGGGTGRVYVYPKLDSAVWTVDEAPSLDRVLAFDPDGGTIAFVDAKGYPGRLDLRETDVVKASKAKLTSLASANGSDIYGITANAQLAVKAWSASQAPTLERNVDKLLAGRYANLEVVSLAGRKAEVNREISQQFNFFNAIVAIAVIVSLLGVVNTLAMSVLERTREIGVLRALGASRWAVRETMLDESLLITLAGAIAGLALGLLIGFVWVGSIGAVMPGITFYLPITAMAGIAIASVIAGVLASALPARRAAKLQVIQALNYE